MVEIGKDKDEFQKLVKEDPTLDHCRKLSKNAAGCP